MVSRSAVIIEATRLAYHYPGEEQSSSPALSGVNLTVHEGEYVALIGPNGSGKTTLLKLFNALLAPSAGKIMVGGLNTAEEAEIPRIRQTCGMIFQNPDNQLVATTVEEDIAFGLENLALPSAEIRKRVAEVAALFGLEQLLKHPPHLLSGGEKQRVAIAGILAMRPKCILMDEPTAMLDPAGRQEVIDAVSLLKQNHNIALIHVTHFPEEAASAERVIALSCGKLVADGPPENVLTNLTLMHGLKLKGTTAVELAALLREDGFSLSPDLLHSRELINSLCSSELKS